MATLSSTQTNTFDYTGEAEIVTVGASGYYDITADGAQGGSGFGRAPGGLGAMASGAIYLTAGAQLEIVVGGEGQSTSPTTGGGGGGGGGHRLTILDCGICEISMGPLLFQGTAACALMN